MMPPMIPMIIIIVMAGIVVVAIIGPTGLVIVCRIVIAVVIGVVIPGPAAKRHAESLRLRIVLGHRQQSQYRQCEDKKSFHCRTFLIIRRDNHRSYSAKDRTRGC